MSTILILFAITFIIKRFSGSASTKIYCKHETPKRVIKKLKVKLRQSKLCITWILISMIIYVIVNDSAFIHYVNQKSSLVFNKNQEFINYYSDTLTYIYVSTGRKSLRFNTFLFLLISGDVNQNPGPGPCLICLRTIAKNHRAVSCYKGHNNIHIKCAGVSPKEFMVMINTNNKYICFICTNQVLPFHNSYNSDVLDEEPINLSENEARSLSFSELKTKKGLNIAHLNVNSLVGKIGFIGFFSSRIKLIY